MQNILITGGAGFIGSNFLRYILKIDSQVRLINLDSLTYAGSMENLKDLPDPERHIFVHGNICDHELVKCLLDKYRIDTIVHFAAESHVDRSIVEPEQFIHTNVLGTFTLLETARRFWLQEESLGSQAVRFHHISTDEVFGSLAPGDPPFSENTRYEPKSPYAASKAASDHLVRAYGNTYGLPFTITNCSNNYGPYQFPEKLIPLMVLNALEGNTLPVYGDGQQIRDWLYVEDHCEAIWMVLHKGASGNTYNIGGGNQPANLTVVHTICEILDELRPNSPHMPHQQLIRFVTDRPGHDRRYAMDISKIKGQLGWQPSHSLIQGLSRAIQWYLEHPEWVNAIRQQKDYQVWMTKNYKNRTDTITA